jgi:hypothetical protein
VVKIYAPPPPPLSQTATPVDDPAHIKIIAPVVILGSLFFAGIAFGAHRLSTRRVVDKADKEHALLSDDVYRGDDTAEEEERATRFYGEDEPKDVFASAPASSRVRLERGSWKHFAPPPAGRNVDDHFALGAAVSGSAIAERTSTAPPHDVNLGRALPALSVTRTQELFASLAEEA